MVVSALREPHHPPDPDRPTLLLVVNNEARKSQGNDWPVILFRLILGVLVAFGVFNVFHGIAR